MDNWDTPVGQPPTAVWQQAIQFSYDVDRNSWSLEVRAHMDPTQIPDPAIDHCIFGDFTDNINLNWPDIPAEYWLLQMVHPTDVYDFCTIAGQFPYPFDFEYFSMHDSYIFEHNPSL